jgi:hygromycin-B 7''-O-kinase
VTAPLLPPVPDREAYSALWRAPGAFLAGVRAVAARHGLPLPTEADRLHGGNAVYAAGRAVVKLVAPLFPDEAPSEIRGLRAAAAAGLPSPALLHEGEIEGWSALVLERMPGERARDAWPRLPRRDREAVLGQAGAALAALHRLDPGAAGFPPAAWPAFAERFRVESPARHLREGVPAGVVGGAEALWRAAGILPAREEGTRAIHADLTPENLLLREGGGRWRLSAVIDFADAMAGPPDYDLMVPVSFLAAGDAGLRRALLAGAGVEDSPERRRRFLGFLLLHRFASVARLLDPARGRSPAGSLEALGEAVFPG